MEIERVAYNLYINSNTNKSIYDKISYDVFVQFIELSWIKIYVDRSKIIIRKEKINKIYEKF